MAFRKNGEGGEGNLLNLLQKEGGTQKGGKRFPQKRRGSNPGGNYRDIYTHIYSITIAHKRVLNYDIYIFSFK